MSNARKPSDLHRNVWLSTGVLLISAAVIFSHTDDLSMWFDELWFVFMNNRDLDHILREHDLNWPPGYMLVLHLWTNLISAHDLVIHVLGALIGLLAVAFMILAGRTLYNHRSGWLAGLAFGTSGYAVYFLLEARGYGLTLMLAAALVAFHARWTSKPTWQRAVPYVLVQIGALYVNFTSGVIIALTAVRVLIVLPYRQWWRWMVIMGVTGLAFLPLFPQFLDSYNLRSRAFSGGDLPSYFLKGPESLFQAYSMHQDAWWLLVLLLAGIGLVGWLWRGNRSPMATTLWLIIWGVGFPVYAYVTRTSQGLFTTRYLVFTLPAVMLLVGIGLAALPRDTWLAGGIVLLFGVSMPWQPFDHRPKYSDSPPVRDLVRELARRFEAYDTLVIDPNLDYGGYDWWYYEPLYFQGGRIPQASDEYEAGSRVWHLVRQGHVDQDVLNSVKAGRIATEFWGPWYFIVTLYEGPPLAPGYTFGERLHYRGHSFPDGLRYMPGDTLNIELWWSVDRPPDHDYSLSVQVVDEDGRIIAQADGGPTGPFTPGQTSAWQPGEVYRDDRSIKLPWCQTPGEYRVLLVVYQWWDGHRLSPANNAPAGSNNSVLLDTIFIDSFAYCNQ